MVNESQIFTHIQRRLVRMGVTNAVKNYLSNSRKKLEENKPQHC